MEQHIDTKSIPKTSLFDQVSFLMTGAIGTMLILADIILSTNGTWPEITLASVAIWIAVAYFVGHLLQMGANIIRDIRFIPLLDWETHSKFLPHETQLLDHARTMFRVEHLHIEQLWNLCFMFASSKDTTNQVETFSAYYNLYRGWFVAFLLQTMVILFATVKSMDPAGLIFVALSLIVTIMLYRRAKLFFQYLRDKVFGIFTIAITPEL